MFAKTTLTVFAVNVKDKYSDVFCGKLATFPGLQHLKKVDKDIKPMVMPDKHIPLSVRPKLKLNSID